MRAPKNTLSDKVQRYILDGIVEGRLVPGQRVREQDIADALGLSRSPVREAVKTLENEGLVLSEPWNGLVIASLSRTEMIELLVYRETLDGLASELASRSITEEELDRLDQFVIELQRDDGTRPAKLVANNRGFHQLIYEAARNEYLLESVGSLRTFLSLLPGVSYEKPERRMVIVQEHKDIIESLRRRDAAAAKEAARLHVRNSAKAQMPFILRSELG